MLVSIIINKTNDKVLQKNPPEITHRKQFQQILTLCIWRNSSCKGLSGYVAEMYLDKRVNRGLFIRHKKLMLELKDICKAQIEKRNNEITKSQH